MDITLRLEEAADYHVVENLTREAFWNVHAPGCDEHFMLRELRRKSAFISGLSIVAEAGGRIVGHIAYSHAKIAGKDGKVFKVLTFGPVSVLPECKGKGIGTALISYSMNLAREMGHKAVVIYGNPAYYERFGFVCGKAFGVRRQDGKFAPALMALQLVKDGLKGAAGKFYEDEAFHVDAKAFEAYEKNFPAKEKFLTDSQKEFERLSQLTLDD